MVLPKYWKYFDTVMFIVIALAIIGISLGIYGVYKGISELVSTLEINLA